jgi:hypothetical protein
MTPRYRLETITVCQGVELERPEHWIYEDGHKCLRVRSRADGHYFTKILNSATGQQKLEALRHARQEAA